MTYREIVAEVSTRSGVPQASVRAVVSALADVLAEQLTEGREVRLPRIGTFTQRWTGPRLVRSIQSRRKRLIDGRYTLRFRPAKAMREAVDSRTGFLLREPAHQEAWRLADTLLSDLAAYGLVNGIQLEEGQTPAEVRATLSEAAGSSWDAVVESYENRVPYALRDDLDHLALAARKRFRG